MKLCVGGRFYDTGKTLAISHPFDGHLVDSVSVAGAAEVEAALTAAVEGARLMARLPAWERAALLLRTAMLMETHKESLARTITLEEGKSLGEARAEVGRAIETTTLSAEEAKRLHGETVPLDASRGVSGKLGFTLRVPCGVVVAISPFNFPLNLMVHKVAPALAAGNAVVMKPPSPTPLSALKFAELLLEAGFPPEAISCLVGPGAEVGLALCEDVRVRKVSFTGSVPVGQAILRHSGIKKVTMELGGNSPIVVLRDADLELAAQAIAATGYANAGQVCISAQRVIVERAVESELLARIVAKVGALNAGDPLAAHTQIGPLISVAEAERVEAWIDEAVQAGARLLVGGERRGALVTPAVLADATPAMRLVREELFGPAVACMVADDFDQAMALANATNFGLAASVFTRDLNQALRFMREADAGNVHVNWGPQWRADLMPYGGFKDSGFGKEGPAYAIQEMTELKMVVVHG